MNNPEIKHRFFAFLKQHQHWLTLVVILAFGLYLRSYHLDYPVVGYHNWKETHYLTESRNFARDGFFVHGFFVPSWDYPDLRSNPSGAHSDTFPTTSIVTALLFKLFGYELWAARLLSVFFSVGSIVLFYLVIKELFLRGDLAIISASVMAINPLFIFFGRQVQLINPALFFTLFGLYYYLRWLKDFSWKNTVLFSVPLFLGVITKYTFALLLIPMFFIFPFVHLFNKDRWQAYTITLFVVVLSAWWLNYSSALSEQIINQLASNKMSILLDANFWQIILSYASDNYTLSGLYFALYGLIIFGLSYANDKRILGYKFVFFYLLGSILWFTVVAFKLKGHSYHQYPMAPLIVFFISYAFISIGTMLERWLGINGIKLPIAFVLVFVLMIPSIEAKNRMFDTYFPGLDIAGEYLKTNKRLGERIMHSGHQAFGLLWHADMKGTRGIPDTVAGIKFAEQNFNAQWMFIYHWDFSIMRDKERWNYIENNYEIKQVGLLHPRSSQIFYLLLRKGGAFKISELKQRLSEQPKQTWNYEFSHGTVAVPYSNFD